MEHWLTPQQVYCLPDAYEVQDPSLDDIKVSNSLPSVHWRMSCSRLSLMHHAVMMMIVKLTASLQFVLHPRYTREFVAKLDSIAVPSHALDGSTYYPGVVGLNNIKNNDYINAVVHSLAHVRPLRDFFLLEENYRAVRPMLLLCMRVRA
jgi:U4/U6.U5 tri-snRNP-associated protein 2